MTQLVTQITRQESMVLQVFSIHLILKMYYILMHDVFTAGGEGMSCQSFSVKGNLA